MIVAPREGQYLARCALQNLRRRAAFLGRRRHQLLFELLLEISVPGALPREVFGSLHQEFCRPARQVQHHLGRHPEVITA